LKIVFGALYGKHNFFPLLEALLVSQES